MVSLSEIRYVRLELLTTKWICLSNDAVRGVVATAGVEVNQNGTSRGGGLLRGEGRCDGEESVHCRDVRVLE